MSIHFTAEEIGDNRRASYPDKHSVCSTCGHTCPATGQWECPECGRWTLRIERGEPRYSKPLPSEVWCFTEIENAEDFAQARRQSRGESARIHVRNIRCDGAEVSVFVVTLRKGHR